MELEFNIKKATHSIFSTMCLSFFLLFLILFSNNKVSRFFETQIFFEVYFVLSFLLIQFILLFRLYTCHKKKMKIEVSEASISIPNIFLGVKSYSIENVGSVEFLRGMNKNLGLVLGIKNRSRYLVDKSIFVNDKDFEKFFNVLQKEVNKKHNEEVLGVFEVLAKGQVNKKSTSTNILALVLITCYLFSLVASANSSPSEEFLLFAANTKEIFLNLEIYRIFSSFWFHTRPNHLILNILVLGLLGQCLEKVFSSIRLINIVFISGIISVLTSNQFSSFDASIGSSGGIFGLWGAYVCLKYKYGKYLPGSINVLPNGRLVFLLIGELLLEIFWLTSVDYYSHIGGFIAGFVYLYFAPLGPKLEYVDQPTLIEKNLSVILVSSYSAGLVYFLFL